ncbi:copper resistance CopC family protein [Dactylosporangium sp. NPDC005555]|uniref:copper resistance CopC family protein n=1 Tax=Dactylosporangium sp. NPDC005555 TaxID=3154889 RepID=UPI0033AFFA5E
MRLHVTLRASLAAAAAVLLMLLTPAPAWAHTTLVKTDPAKGATVTAPLTAVTLTFTEMVKQQFSTIVVTGADGVSYSDGMPKSVDKTLSQPVKALPPGLVTVVWRTAAGDGHPLEGQFTFTNAAPAPPPSPSASPSPSPSPAASSAAAPTAAADPVSDGSGSGAGLWWAALGGLAVLLVLGGVVLRTRRRRN